jgi:hypothetical protein
MKHCLTILAFFILTSSLLGQIGTLGRDFRGLGRDSASVSIGFTNLSEGKVDKSGFNFGLGGNLSIIEDPDLFGFDVNAGYDFSKIKDYKHNTFGVGATPFLKVNQYFKPYLQLNAGMANVKSGSNSDSESYFGFGLGFESEFTEQFLISIGYAKDFIDSEDTNEFGGGVSYWFENSLVLGLDVSFGSVQKSDTINVEFSTGFAF